MSLDRFTEAQVDTWGDALAELQAGAKQDHWIWWIFPQLRGLGSSKYSVLYGLADEAEALAFFVHPVLGPRYRQCVDVVHRHLCLGRLSPLELMGSSIDVLKLRSSLELFLKIAPPSEGDFRTKASAVLAVLRQDHDS